MRPSRIARTSLRDASSRERLYVCGRWSEEHSPKDVNLLRPRQETSADPRYGRLAALRGINGTWLRYTPRRPRLTELPITHGHLKTAAWTYRFSFALRRRVSDARTAPQSSGNKPASTSIGRPRLSSNLCGSRRSHAWPAVLLWKPDDRGSRHRVFGDQTIAMTRESAQRGTDWLLTLTHKDQQATGCQVYWLTRPLRAREPSPERGAARDRPTGPP